VKLHQHEVFPLPLCLAGVHASRFRRPVQWRKRPQPHMRARYI